MGNDSTAIHDMLAGFNRKAIADDPDDDILFAGSRRREEAPTPSLPRPNAPRAGMFTLPPPPPPPPMMIPAAGTPMAGAPAVSYPAPTRVAAGTQPPPVTGPIVMTAPAAPTIQMNVALAQQTIVPLPQAFQRHPAYALDGGGTVRVSRVASVGGNTKMYALAAGLFAIVVVLLTVLVTGGDKKPAKVAAATAESPKVAKVEAEPIEAPAPVAAAPVEAKPAAVEAPAAAVVEAPAVVEASAVVEAPAATPEAAPAPVAAAEPTVPVEPVLSKDLIAPPEVVPASAFTAKHESTLGGATVTATPIETTPPPAVAKVAEAPVEAEKAPVATKKSRRELAREKRAAKRAAKRERAKRVATVEKAKPAAKSKSEDLNGNGALAITSSQPREVWVDGRNSKRSTPLRVLLKPGKHTVTLFDKSNGTAKTFSVDIKADTTTNVAK